MLGPTECPTTCLHVVFSCTLSPNLYCSMIVILSQSVHLYLIFILTSKPAVVDCFSDLSKKMCHCIRRKLEKGRQFKQGKVSVSQPVIKIPRGREISGCADFKTSCVFYYCVLQQIELCCAVVVDATK